MMMKNEEEQEREEEEREEEEEEGNQTLKQRGEIIGREQQTFDSFYYMWRGHDWINWNLGVQEGPGTGSRVV